MSWNPGGAQADFGDRGPLCTVWFYIRGARWSRGKHRPAGSFLALAGSQGEPTSCPHPSAGGLRLLLKQPMAVRGGSRCLGGGARLEEVERGRGRGDRSPGGGTGARGGASVSRGCVLRPPGTETRSPPPSPRRLAASPRGGAGQPESLGVTKV